MNSLALIQLVSEQTTQNLLPVLALKPAKTIHLAAPKVADRSGHVFEAARRAGLRGEPETLPLSVMPRIEEARQVVSRKYLAVYLPLVGRQKTDRARRAAELHITLLSCQDGKIGEAWNTTRKDSMP